MQLLGGTSDGAVRKESVEELTGLAVRASGGCMAAREELYLRLRNWLLTVIRTVPGLRPERVEDALQEVMVHLYARLPKYKPDRPLLPWLATVVRHRVFDFAAAERRHAGLALDGVSEPAQFDPDDLEAWEERLGLWACIYFDSPLTREERIIVVHYEKSLGARDRLGLARAMGLRPGAFDRFWSSARLKLRDCMTRKSF